MESLFKFEKKMRQEISLEERKKIQLSMLEEIHSFCESHAIRYSISYGTLLGAVRHKGFIPWDDDVDLMMPLPDMLKFKSEFASDKLKYCDVDTEPYYEYSFSRISYKPTYRKVGLRCKSYGVNIDLYPVVCLPNSLEEQTAYFEEAERLNNIRHCYMRWRRRIIRRIPISTIPGYKHSIIKVRDHELFNTVEFETSNVFYVNSGPISEKDTCLYSYNIFKDTILLPFENLILRAVSCYDDFLRVCYGDYMQLPPEEERHPYHGGGYYWL